MLIKHFKKFTNQNNRQLLRFLKEYHIQYDFLDELKNQKNIKNMIDFFLNLMCYNNPYNTLLFERYSFSFSLIKNIDRRTRFFNFLKILEQNYSYDGKTNFNTK